MKSSSRNTMVETKSLESTASGIVRSITDIRPAHYFLKIDSFSFLLEMLKKENAESYDSKIFEASGYKWKLSLYPNGNEERNGAGHISLYLCIEETSALPLGWEVNAHLRFSVFDQIREKYLTIQVDARRFSAMKKSWGIPKLLPLNDFNDATKGYLVHDECVFGVEISVCNYSGKGECLARPEKLSNSFYTWKVTKYSTLPNICQSSSIFTLGNRKWKINLYPRGNGRYEGKSVSAYLQSCDTDTMGEVYAEYKLSIEYQYQYQKHTCHCEKEANHLFTSAGDWGFSNLLSLDDNKDALKGLLVEDTLIVEVEITRISTLKSFS